MLPLILFVPMAVAVAVLFGYAARGAARGYGSGRLTPLSLLLGADLVAGVALVAVDEPWSRWAAVGVAALVVVPLLAPLALVSAAAVIGKLTGNPVRWN